ncbi:MAG: hypothetical protein ACIAXF_08745 [Phycisphaerales bacterium JB063]
MRGTPYRYAPLIAGLLATLPPCAALAQPALVDDGAPGVPLVAEQDAAGESEASRSAEADRLAGACLSLQAEQRGLREAVRSSVAGLNSTLLALMEAAKVLTEPSAAPEAAAPAAAQIESLLAEEAQIERWLWGEELPDRPGVSRASLRERLAALRQERQNAGLLVQAYTLVGAFDREQLRTRMLEQAELLRAEIGSATQPMRDQLSALEQQAAREGEAFEEVMARFARISQEGPVSVEAVRADGWFQHGLVSFRWSDRRGRLVATARIRLRPSVDRDMPPPLLLDRFAIISLTDQEAMVSVGYFTVEFSAAVEELTGEPQLLEALVRLLDLEGLGNVQPTAKSSAQN